jgi:hypothetical protein
VRKSPRTITRSIVFGLFSVGGIVSIGVLPTACSEGGVGDPCTPEDEYNANFQGFKVTEENIESRSFQCETRICLVNHFQGRVSCPLGQPAPIKCNGPGDDGACGEGKCSEAATLAPDCDPKGDGAAQCSQFGGVCNKDGKFCECSEGSCPEGFVCDTKIKQCKSYVCHKPGNCQTTDGENSTDKACCVPGTDTPVATSVCGQCGESSNRRAEQAVYCSCRCGVAEGEEEDENFNFCECPDGFECSEIRKNVGLGDKQITGKYCIKAGTGTDATNAPLDCKQVQGYFNSTQCDGIGGG